MTSETAFYPRMYNPYQNSYKKYQIFKIAYQKRLIRTRQIWYDLIIFLVRSHHFLGLGLGLGLRTWTLTDSRAWTLTDSRTWTLTDSRAWTLTDSRAWTLNSLRPRSGSVWVMGRSPLKRKYIIDCLL